MMVAELSRESIEEVACTDLQRACEQARQLVAEQPYDEDSAKLLKELVQRLVRELPPRPDPEADLPPPLREASQLLSAGRDEPAEIVLRSYLSDHPRDVRAMSMMGEIAARCEFYDQAQKILMRALAIEPQSVDVLLALGKLVNHLNYLEPRNRGDEALELLEKALAIDPRNIDAVSLHSSILVRFRRLDEAVPTYIHLLELDPLHWLAWTNFGSILNSLGRFGEAIAALRTATAIRPQHGLAWWEIANLKISKLFPADIEQMENILADPAVTAESRAHIHFALARAYDQAKRFEQAADHLAQGNEIKCQMVPHDPEQITAEVADSERVFTADFLRRRKSAGDPCSDPIFIVGMQRAGTTLVEQILASHSAIEGTEELFILLQLAKELDVRNADVPWQTALEQISPNLIEAMTAGFMKSAERYRDTGRPHFIDKNPANWRFVGLIATILPNAKIIDVRRNPMDCCFANYSQHYEHGVGFSYSQTALGRYYADYVRLMRHFDKVAPGLVHRVIYDDLVEDLEGGVRGMLDYLGLPFEEQCLRFYETDRTVLTPSSQQVRQPINRSGIGRWLNYKPWLGELEEGLGDALLNWRS